MSDINRICITGRLTRDSVVKYTPSGFAIANLSVAVNKSVKQPNGSYANEAYFFDVKLLGKRAEFLTPKLVKGTPVSIDGSLEQSRWKNQDGQERSKLEIVVDEIAIFTRSEKQQEPQTDQEFKNDIPF